MLYCDVKIEFISTSYSSNTFSKGKLKFELGLPIPFPLLLCDATHQNGMSCFFYLLSTMLPVNYMGPGSVNLSHSIYGLPYHIFHFILSACRPCARQACARCLLGNYTPCYSSESYGYWSCQNRQVGILMNKDGHISVNIIWSRFVVVGGYFYIFFFSTGLHSW